MFMGPMDGYPDFRDTGIEGMRKFVDRIWSLFQNVNDQSEARNAQLDIKMHQTIKRVTEDIKDFKYNTAIAAIMEYVNVLRGLVTKKEPLRSDYVVTLILLLAPFTPHLAEEVWMKLNVSKLGKVPKVSKAIDTSDTLKSFDTSSSVHTQPWPKYDPKFVIEEKITIPIQINGKLRGIIEIDAGNKDDEKFVLAESKCIERIQKWLVDGKVVKEIYIPGRLVNFVIGRS